MGTYDPAELLTWLIEQSEKGIEFAQAGGKKISDAMMVSKGNTLLEQTVLFNEDISDWRRQTADQKIWAHFEFFFTNTTASRGKQ